MSIGEQLAKMRLDGTVRRFWRILTKSVSAPLPHCCCIKAAVGSTNELLFFSSGRSDIFIATNVKRRKAPAGRHIYLHVALGGASGLNVRVLFLSSLPKSRDAQLFLYPLACFARRIRYWWV